MTGRIARNYWGRKFLRKLKKLGLTNKLYAIYVDNVVASLYSINSDWDVDVNKGMMVFSK